MEVFTHKKKNIMISRSNNLSGTLLSPADQSLLLLRAVSSWKSVLVSLSPSYCQLTLFLTSPAFTTAIG